MLPKAFKKSRLNEIDHSWPWLCGSAKICCLSSSQNVFGSRSMGAASRLQRMACTSAISHTPQSYLLCCQVVPYSGSHQKLHDSRSMHYRNNRFLPRMPVKSIPALRVCECPNSIHILLKKLGIDCSRQSIKQTLGCCTSNTHCAPCLLISCLFGRGMLSRYWSSHFWKCTMPKSQWQHQCEKNGMVQHDALKRLSLIC